MRIINFLFLTALLTLSHAALVAADGGHVTVRAILVVGSHQGGKSDPRLARYEANLKGILEVESVRVLSEGSASLAAPGKGTVSLGSDKSLDVQAEKSDGKGVYLRVNWQEGGRTVIDNGRDMSPGVPMILALPAVGKADEVFAVIVIVD